MRRPWQDGGMVRRVSVRNLLRSRRKADSNAGLAGGSGHRSGAVIESGCSQDWKCREISNPEVDRKRIAPPPTGNPSSLGSRRVAR